MLSEEASGEPLADHQVDLAGAPAEFAAFTDLYRYLRWNAVPDRRTASEVEIAGRVGAWAAGAVLGRAVFEAIVAAAPVTVRVVVPEGAGFVLSWPLELAHAGGRPLAARGDVTLTYDLAPGPAGRSPISGPGTAAMRSSLRMLAVFSLPTATSVLALRRERFELARLVRRIAARQRRLVELTVVQYGATRKRLKAVADAGDGWDVLHLSGHGEPAADAADVVVKPGGLMDHDHTGIRRRTVRQRQIRGAEGFGSHRFSLARCRRRRPVHLPFSEETMVPPSCGQAAFIVRSESLQVSWGSPAP